MALIARKKKGLTDKQQAYMDILIEEYGGFVPYGEKKKIAERIGCSTAYISQMDRGDCTLWTEEYKRRIQDVIPLSDPVVRAAQLQRIYSDVVERRQKKGMALSSKDPVDILDTMGRTQPAVNATQNIGQQTVFNIGGLSDERLTELIVGLERLLREGDLEQLQRLGDIIDGSATDIDDASPDSIGGDEGGEAEAGRTEGWSVSQD